MFGLRVRRVFFFQDVFTSPSLLLDEHLDKVASKIISGLERVEAIVTTRGSKIRFLHIDINDVVDVSVTSVPSIVYFKNGEPIVYDGTDCALSLSQSTPAEMGVCN